MNQQFLFNSFSSPFKKDFKPSYIQPMLNSSKFFFFIFDTIFKGFKVFFSFQPYISIKFLLKELFSIEPLSFFIFFYSPLFLNLFSFSTFISNNLSKNKKLEFTTNVFFDENLHNQTLFGFQEQTLHYRNQRLQNPIFRYDFKLGNYMSDDAKMRSPYLFTSIHDLTTGVRKPT